MPAVSLISIRNMAQIGGGVATHSISSVFFFFFFFKKKKKKKKKKKLLIHVDRAASWIGSCC